MRRKILIIIGIMMLTVGMSSTGVNQPLISLSTTNTTLQPTIGATYLDSARTANFLRTTQNIAKFNGSSIDEIYYKLGSIKLLDPTFSILTASEKTYFITQVESFQNTNGGYGSWYKDASSLSSTIKAVEILNWLGEIDTINTNAVDESKIALYVESLYNNLTSGYNGNQYDGDSDIYTSYLAVKIYSLLPGIVIPRVSQLTNLFLKAQNNDSTLYSVDELGGYGKQTNNQKGIYWDSEVVITKAAVNSLSLLGSSGDNTTVINFLQKKQQTSGGFKNSNDTLISESISYTGSALSALSLLNSVPLDTSTSSLSYILSYENTDGGFKLKSTSTKSTLKATFFALQGLNAVAGSPSNVTKTLEFIHNWVSNDGGYGAAPGESSTLRETFDAVSALTMMSRTPTKITAILAYVESYRQLDGGYGITNSYTESTLRAVEIYNLLGKLSSFPNPTATISFLQGLQGTDGGFVKGNGKTISYVISTYRAVKALQILGSQPTDVNKAITFTLNSYKSSEGGFGGFATDVDSDISSTYRALRIFEILGYTSYDKVAVTTFIKNSQNPDGGFKRSSHDILRPKNVSSATYTYSALRSLMILSEQPLNQSGIYSYVKDLRNRDGGFAKHDRFTSDVAYTFTSLWILKNINYFQKFSVSLPSKTQFYQNETITLSFSGNLFPINYTVSATGMVFKGLLNSTGELLIDGSALTIGSYNFTINAFDLSGQTIVGNFLFDIISSTSTPTTSPNNSTTPVSSDSSTTTTTFEPITISTNGTQIVITDTNSAPAFLFASIFSIVGIISIFVSKRRR